MSGVSAGHSSAPARWRKILHTQRGPFEGWKVLVVVADAKKRAAYKRLLEVGCAVIVNGKSPYQSSLASKLTHVFVETALHNEIKALQLAGVQCLSPDYIPEFLLQDPTPPPAVFLITSYKSPVCLAAVGRLQRTAGRLKYTPDLGSDAMLSRIGKENHLSTIASTPTKTKASSSEHLCASESLNKKQRQDHINDRVDFTCVDKWRPVSTLNGCSSKAHKVCAAEFPGYVMNSIDGYLEESHESTVLHVIKSFMTSVRYPPASLLCTVIDQLQKSPLVHATKAFLLLQRLLVFHPPSHNSSLYQPTLNLHTNAEGTSVEGSVCDWEFLKTICSETDGNSLLLLRFVITLLERDFHGHSGSAGVLSASETLISLKMSLIWQMFWGESSGVSFNTRLRELLGISWNAAYRACDDPKEIPVLHSLQSVITMVSQIHVFTDIHSMKCTRESLGTRLSECSRTFVTEVTLGGRQRSGASLKRFLETCGSTWLKMHVTDMLLANYSDCLVPLERRCLKIKPISLEKIVLYYFLLVPTAAASSPATKATRRERGVPLHDIGIAKAHNASRNSVGGVNRRNARGETQLHIACIKNDALKVKQLLAAGGDANSTDYAGWTPLHEACNHGNLESVRELLKSRQPVLEINSEDDPCRVLNLLSAPKCGTTPLHDAAGNDHLKVVELLVAAGGLPLMQAKNDCGQTPFDITSDAKVKEFLQSMESKSRVLSSCDSTEAICPKVPKHSSEECEEYTLILAQLVQSYFRMSKGAADNWVNFTAHVDNLEGHVTRISRNRRLSAVTRIRLAAMRMLIG